MIVTIAIIFYACIQFIRLMDFGDTSIQVSTRDNFFETDFKFPSDDGLMVAFALTAYDEVYESIEDSDYGTMKAYYI